MEASEGQDWRALLDRLSACITPREEAAVRHAAVDRGNRSHVIKLHHHGLLVQHIIITWYLLLSSFLGGPEYCAY